MEQEESTALFFRFFDDCERRCTEANRTLLYAAVFKSLKRPRQIFLKLVGSDFGEQQMVVAVNGNLVPFPLNFANQFGQALGDPAQNEESGAGPVFIEQGQYSLCAFVSSQLTLTPVLFLNLRILEKHSFKYDSPP